MKIVKHTSVLFGLLFLSLASFADPASSSPVGHWQTIDDVTGKPRSIVRIEDHDGALEGFIEKTLPIEGVVDDPVCTKCEGDRKNQPIIGLKFIWDLKGKDGEYSGGQILDPKNGKIYHGKIKITDEGSKLSVRGYIGISLFGRSQTWSRVP